MMDKIVNIIFDALRALCAFLCEIIYPGIATLYELFTEIGTVVYAGNLDVIYNKISLIIGIFMVFRVTFWLIESLINPDTISDKEKNPGKIIQKVLVSVVLLAITPTLFETAFDIQRKIIDSHIIEKIVSIDNPPQSSTAGKFIAAELFINFYTPAIIDDQTANTDCTQKFTGKDGMLYEDLIDYGKLDNLNNECLTEKHNDKYTIDFNGLFATAVGGFVFWMILMYCISVGARYAQLIYLQVIAPIPIMCYLTPNKDSMFSKWLKQCTTTYLDLFIRIAIINFVMVLCNMLLKNDSFLLATDNGWVKIFLVLGLLIFAKKAPDLVQELLPKSVTKASGDFGLSLKKRTDNMFGGKAITKGVGFATAGAVGLATRPLIRGYNTAKYNAKEDKKLARFRQQRISQIMGSNVMNDDQKQKIADKYRNMSNAELRKELRNSTNAKMAEYNSLLGDTSEKAVARRRELMEQITANENSGIGHRNQIVTAATSIIGATTGAATAAVKGKSVSQIFKSAMENQTKNIKKEQEWYKMGGSSDFVDIVKRTISEVQRTFAIETEGQAVQYVIDEYKAEIKEEEEKLTQEREKEKAYSSAQSSIKTVESEGSSDLSKNKPVLVYKNGQWQKEVLSDRVDTMKTSLERTKEFFNNMSPTVGSRKVNENDQEYGILKNLLMTTGMSDAEATTMLENSYIKNGTTYENAFNQILTSKAHEISKKESDYGKMQAAAGLAYHLCTRKNLASNKTILDDENNGTDAYKNQSIINEFDSLIREIEENPSRYSQNVKDLKSQIESFVYKKDNNGNIIGYRNLEENFNEVEFAKLAKSWGKLKDAFEIEKAQVSLNVSDLNDSVQSKKQEASAFEHYSETQKKLNNDKFGGGK